MEDSRIHKRYALALYQLAGELNQLDRVYDDMRLIAQTCLDSKELMRLLASPVIRDTKKGKILAEIFGGKINELSQRFIDQVVMQNREVSLPSIALEFTQLVKDFKGIKTAIVTSAQPLDAETRAKIIAKLKKQTGSEVELVEKTDPEILGGFTLSLEGQLFDASVKNTMHRLRKEFNEKTNKSEI
ncbi:MAG: ATP synthase F1 subunit delta [Bacteroidota bacterium]|nr:ATP synthase F1 subunit delta [Bacteroidota bacterium]